ncbi:MAG: hypothetical protein ACRDRX_27455 [Pseudonocardiaceae bacterium]
MSTVEFEQFALVIEYGWLALFPPVVWFVLRTRIARTIAMIIRVSAWDQLLRRKGVPVRTRRALIADAAKRDLESP